VNTKEIDFVSVKESTAALYDLKLGSNEKIPKAILESEKNIRMSFCK